MSNCVIVTWFNNGQTGYLDFSYRILSLSKSCQVTVLSRGKLFQEELISPRIRYVNAPAKGAGVFAWLRYLVWVKQQITKLHPDKVILLHSKLSALAAFMNKVPTAIYWNEHPTHCFPSPAKTSAAKGILNRLLRKISYIGACRADVVMPIGEAHRDDLVSKGCQPQRIKLIYMGVASQFAMDATGHEYGIITTAPNPKPLNLVYIGSVKKARGRDVMLEALALVNKASVKARLKIIGASPDEQDYCTKRIVDLGAEAYIEVYARIPGSLIPGHLRGADAGICIWEDRIYWRFNPPTKLFEYLVAGLPVLASRICTHTQYITHWENGIIFDYDPEALAESISNLWRNQADIPLLKARSREYGKRFLWGAIEPDFMNAIDLIDSGKTANA